MKTLFSRKRNSLLGNGSGAIWGIGIGIFVLLIIIIRFFVPGLLTALASPLWQLGSATSAVGVNTSSIFSDKAALTKQRDTLSAENIALVNENRMLLEKTRDIEKLVGTSTPEGNRIAAGVLARPPITPYDTLIINAGKDGTLVNGARVFGPGNVPIGNVTETHGTTATVTLYSAAGRVNDGWAGENRIPLTLTGAGAGAFRATVPRDTGIVVGDILYLPGPGALPVGRVVHLDTDPSSPQAVLQIQPAVNIFSLTWVSVAENAS